MRLFTGIAWTSLRVARQKKKEKNKETCLLFRQCRVCRPDLSNISEWDRTIEGLRSGKVKNTCDTSGIGNREIKFFCDANDVLNDVVPRKMQRQLRSHTPVYFSTIECLSDVSYKLVPSKYKVTFGELYFEVLLSDQGSPYQAVTGKIYRFKQQF